MSNNTYTVNIPVLLDNKEGIIDIKSTSALNKNNNNKNQQLQESKHRYFNVLKCI